VRAVGRGVVRGRRRPVCGERLRVGDVLQLHVPARRGRRRQRERVAPRGLFRRGGLHGAEGPRRRHEDASRASGVGGGGVRRVGRSVRDARIRVRGGGPARERRVPRHVHVRGYGLAVGLLPSRAGGARRPGGIQGRRVGGRTGPPAPLPRVDGPRSARVPPARVRLSVVLRRAFLRRRGRFLLLHERPRAGALRARGRGRRRGGAVRAWHEHFRRRGDRPARGLRALRVPRGVGPDGRGRGRAERGDDGLRTGRDGVLALAFGLAVQVVFGRRPREASRAAGSRRSPRRGAPSPRRSTPGSTASRTACAHRTSRSAGR